MRASALTVTTLRVGGLTFSGVANPAPVELLAARMLLEIGLPPKGGVENGVVIRVELCRNRTWLLAAPRGDIDLLCSRKPHGMW